mmetsp:Transcript_2419/g.6495  ORF Transcript_2419/g.6495 Transcript_2419/m.6495 type:complete len:245 (-) Transcript_2419:265-999(-)
MRKFPVPVSHVAGPLDGEASVGFRKGFENGRHDVLVPDQDLPEAVHGFPELVESLHVDDGKATAEGCRGALEELGVVHAPHQIVEVGENDHVRVHVQGQTHPPRGQHLVCEEAIVPTQRHSRIEVVVAKSGPEKLPPLLVVGLHVVQVDRDLIAPQRASQLGVPDPLSDGTVGILVAQDVDLQVGVDRSVHQDALEGNLPGAIQRLGRAHHAKQHVQGLLLVFLCGFWTVRLRDCFCVCVCVCV